jgi:hypothetical protein
MWKLTKILFEIHYVPEKQNINSEWFSGFVLMQQFPVLSLRGTGTAVAVL